MVCPLIANGQSPVWQFHLKKECFFQKGYNILDNAGLPSLLSLLPALRIFCSMQLNTGTIHTSCVQSVQKYRMHITCTFKSKNLVMLLEKMNTRGQKMINPCAYFLFIFEIISWLCLLKMCWNYWMFMI